MKYVVSDAMYVQNMRIIGAVVLFLAFCLGAIALNAVLPRIRIWRENRAIARRDRKPDLFQLCWPPRRDISRRQFITCRHCRARLTVAQALAHHCSGIYEDLQ